MASRMSSIEVATRPSCRRCTSVRIEEGHHRNAADPRLQESVRKALDARGVEEDPRAVEQIAAIGVAHGAGHGDIRQPRGRGLHVVVIGLAARHRPAGQRELHVRQLPRELQRQLRAFQRAQVAHPQHVDVLLAAAPRARRLDHHVDHAAVETVVLAQQLRLELGLRRNQVGVPQSVVVELAIAPELDAAMFLLAVAVGSDAEDEAAARSCGRTTR